MSFIIASSLSPHVIVDAEHRDAERVDVAVRIDLDAVLEPCERLAEAAEIEVADRLANRLLVGLAEPRRPQFKRVPPPP